MFASVHRTLSSMSVLRELVAKHCAHFGNIDCLAFSPDGKQIVSCSFDNTIKVWDCAAAISNIVLLQHFPHVLPPSAPQPHLWSSRQR